MMTQTPEMHAVVERLERLERQNRRLERAGALALACVGALVLMAQARQPRTLEAEQFVIRDQQGRVRAEMGLYDDFLAKSAHARTGSNRPGGGVLFPAVKLFDDRGNSRAVLEAYPLGQSLDFYDDNGNTRVELFHSDNFGSEGLQIFGPPGEAEHGRTPSEDAEGAVLAISDELFKTGPLLRIWDRRGFEATLGGVDRYSPLYPTSAASLVLVGKDGKVVWRAP